MSGSSFGVGKEFTGGGAFSTPEGEGLLILSPLDDVSL
jgi:hypothetical protein